MTRTLHSADVVITMDPARRVIERGAVLVDGQTIAAVGPADALRALAPDAVETVHARRVLMPGLVNAHLHSGLLRGTAEGLPVWDWLRLYIDPMHRVLLPEDAEAACRLAYAESILSGTTTVVDMWRYLDGGARAARDLGLRAVLVPYVGEHPDHDYFETLATNAALIEGWHGGADGRVTVWVGMEHLFYFTDEAVARAVALAKDADTGLHTHANESKIDLPESERRWGKRPILRMRDLGMLDVPKLHLAHCVWLDDDERRAMADHNVGVSHNPMSNMKLASGAAEVQKLLDLGIAVGLGTDGEKENNNFDIFEEMKAASLMAKLVTGDAAALDAWDVLGCATIGGARALGMDDRIGSLTPGKQADMIAVRLDVPRMTPVMLGDWFNLHHNLVHAARGGDVAMTMVAGRVLQSDGVLLTGDIHAIMAGVQTQVGPLFARRAAWLAEHGDGAAVPVSESRA